ncbi:hypothetical protein M2271_000246 [Streptomyces sp. LBL]|uniref:hypothetical protein n=1 Tax=Streptomyces sp. LBL TaxID=2940562 RepID=UPI002473BE37|nr:hypothetical protein [Streptomyces sp. LBL]MDH6622459.1 hypothetical protein [Streptomyces sp. LBL]
MLVVDQVAEATKIATEPTPCSKTTLPDPGAVEAQPFAVLVPHTEYFGRRP